MGDDRFEPDERFSVVLSNATGGYIADGTGVCTIRNDDSPITRIQLLPAIGVEPVAGQVSTAQFTLKISGEIVRPVVLEYMTRDGSANSRQDYRPKSGTLTIYPGEVEKRVWVSILGDRRLERDETFSLVVTSRGNRDVLFSNPSTPSTGGSTAGSGEATGHILDSDSRTFAVVPHARAVNAGSNASFTIVLGRLAGFGAALPPPLAVAGIAPSQLAAVMSSVRFATRYAVASGTATSRERYAAMSGPRAGTAELGYVVNESGSLVPRTAVTVDVPTTSVPLGRSVAMWLFNAEGGRLGPASQAQSAIVPGVEAAFASLGSSSRSPRRR
jgi:hypothetical protein